MGRVYAANTVGAIIGALAFSLLVIPLAGTQWAQRLLIGLAAAAALVVFAPFIASRSDSLEDESLLKSKIENRKSKIDQCLVPSASSSLIGRQAIAIALPILLGLAALLAWRVVPAPWGLVAYGRYMATYGGRLAAGIETRKTFAGSGLPDIYCTFLGEGRNGSVAVTKWTSGERNFHSAGQSAGIERAARHAPATDAGTHLRAGPPEAGVGAGGGV